MRFSLFFKLFLVSALSLSLVAADDIATLLRKKFTIELEEVDASELPIYKVKPFDNPLRHIFHKIKNQKTITVLLLRQRCSGAGPWLQNIVLIKNKEKL